MLIWMIFKSYQVRCGNSAAMTKNKNRPKAAKSLISLVAGVGFEPTTFRL
jgi:hypothetical protein